MRYVLPLPHTLSLQFSNLSLYGSHFARIPADSLSDIQQLKFGQRFQVQSLGHLHREWLNITPMTPLLKKLDAPIAVWLSAPGSSVSLRDAENPQNEGYIEDGSVVHFTIDGFTIVNANEDGPLLLDKWDSAKPNGVEPLKFHYKAVRVVGSESS